ncbi:MAG: hypothetical protein R2733_01935 [Acidimicrobiales bacterium]
MTDDDMSKSNDMSNSDDLTIDGTNLRQILDSLQPGALLPRTSQPTGGHRADELTITQAPPTGGWTMPPVGDRWTPPLAVVPSTVFEQRAGLSAVQLAAVAGTIALGVVLGVLVGFG